jgi:hypothetical protein
MIRSAWLGRVAARVLLAIIAVFSTSCGLDGQTGAEVIAADDVDYELLGTTTSTTSTTLVETPIFAVSFFWHTAGDNSLRQVVRGRDSQPDPAMTLLELVAGPTAADLEQNPDLQTRLDESMEPELLGPDDDGQARIRIQRSAEESLTTDQAAEFVCTATQFQAISAITIVDADDTPFSLSGLGAVPIVGAARPSDFGDCVEDPLPGETNEPEESTTTES